MRPAPRRRIANPPMRTYYDAWNVSTLWPARTTPFATSSHLIIPGEPQDDTTENTEDSERDGLGHCEVGGVDEGPGLDDDDEGVEVCKREVEGDLQRMLDSVERPTGAKREGER